MYDDPWNVLGSFPKTAAWAEANISQEAFASFREIHYCVEYHGYRAKEQASLCWEALAGMTPSDGYRVWEGPGGPMADMPAVYPEVLVWHGDIAIREAVTTLEVGWQVVNHVLGLGIPPDKLHWRTSNPQHCLRCHIKKENFWLPLLNTMDAIFGERKETASDEYKHLQSYRHWVTHRGAPHIVTKGLEDPVPIPPERDYVPSPLVEAGVISAEYDESRRLQHRAREAISRAMRDRIEIWCAQFAPDEYYIVTPADLEQVTDSTGFVIGVAFVPPGTPVPAGRSERFAEQDVVAYPCSQYQNSVINLARSFLRTTVDQWDTALHDACVTRPAGATT